MQKCTKIKYILYARKSSESEDRQVASIESQIDFLTEMAKRERLEIVDVIFEARSAKAPGRPDFNKMLEIIYKGKANGIICWKLDRLARNPIDGGQIMWMLQQGLIKEKLRLQELLNDMDCRVNKWLEKAETIFNFAKDAKRKFETGNLEEKREILAALGSNLTLKDKKLQISIQKPLILIQKVSEGVKAIHSRLEPVKKGENEFNLEKEYSKSSVLLPKYKQSHQSSN